MSDAGLFDLFRIGVGPSSSHTVGPMRAAAAFMESFPQAEGVGAELHGSLALTGEGHGTDRALIVGLAGHAPDTVPLDLLAGAVEAAAADGGMERVDGGWLAFDPRSDIVRVESLHPAHANVLRFTAVVDGEPVEQWFASVGGGSIERLVEGAVPPAPEAGEATPWSSCAELLQRCASAGTTIADEVLAAETAQGMTVDEVSAGLAEIALVMEESIERGLGASGALPGMGVKRRARSLAEALEADDRESSLPPTFAADRAGIYATAVNEENAAGARIVTAPTNGAAGIVPAVLRFMREFCTPKVETPGAVFLLTAAGIGGLIKRGAGVSGAELGCQGEVGAACSMAAAGLAACLGGTPSQVENAAEIALEHHLGMTCDPVGGFVQVPCIERNAVGAVKAITAASMALRGSGEHLVSLDVAIETLRQTGQDMDHRYKETSLGGLAVNVPSC